MQSLHPFLRLWALAAFVSIGWLSAWSARAEAPAAVACAVLGTGDRESSQSLCQALGRELGKAMIWVEDGRSAKKGEALHIIKEDVVWTVIWLRNGQTRAFTRVSAVDATGREALMLGRAAKVLSREAVEPRKECVRVEPNGGRRMRNPELAYPWVNLKQCRVHTIDVIDPWWTASGK
jgi:hypothetical protein